MSVSRGGFSSRIGFIMAAAGSAVGLGNIWGFPTQTASNGGAAFVLVYLVLAFCLAYPAFMAESERRSSISVNIERKPRHTQAKGKPPLLGRTYRGLPQSGEELSRAAVPVSPHL